MKINLVRSLKNIFEPLKVDANIYLPIDIGVGQYHGNSPLVISTGHTGEIKVFEREIFDIFLVIKDCHR